MWFLLCSIVPTCLRAACKAFGDARPAGKVWLLYFELRHYQKLHVNLLTN
jgi:hypothetical protein